MNLKTYVINILLVVALISCSSDGNNNQQDNTDLIDSVKLEVITHHWDGVFNWSQARVAAIPGMEEQGRERILLTMQKWFVAHSDFYSGLYTMFSDDLGKNWTSPKEQPELGWKDLDNGIVVGICDIVPGWHSPTAKIIALGHTVYYLKNHKQLQQGRARSTAYAVYDPKTDQWQPWKQLEMPDKHKFFNSGSGCAQWLVKSDGTLLIPAYFKAQNDTTKCYSSTILHCKFDGKVLTYIEHGDELKWNEPRGVYEPSLTFFKGKYYLTLRNDKRGYVTVSNDAMHWQPIKPWTFDDGKELGSYNTQQHWVTHSKGLFLVYTRRGANNDHIPRSRAPLFIARVNPGNLFVIRDTEKVLIPERGVMMGNFGVSNINDRETWVTVGENMYPPKNLDQGANGSVFAARIFWTKPNKLSLNNNVIE